MSEPASTTPPPTDSASNEKRPSSASWMRTFGLGFAMAFCLALLFVSDYVYTGSYLVRVKLWQLYLLELQRGPSPAMFSSLGTHLGVSSIGGVAAVAIRAVYRWLRA